MIVFNLTPQFLVISEREEHEQSLCTRMVLRTGISEIRIEEPDSTDDSDIRLTITANRDEIELCPTREELAQARHVIGQL